MPLLEELLLDDELVELEEELVELEEDELELELEDELELDEELDPDEEFDPLPPQPVRKTPITAKDPKIILRMKFSLAREK